MFSNCFEKALYWNPYLKKVERLLKEKEKEKGLKVFDQVSKEIFPYAILDGSFYEPKVEMK